MASHHVMLSAMHVGTAMSYDVRVTRVNEGEHQTSEENFSGVEAVTVKDGEVHVAMPEGRSASFGATTWGSVTIVRVPGR